MGVIDSIFGIKDPTDPATLMADQLMRRYALLQASEGLAEKIFKKSDDEDELDKKLDTNIKKKSLGLPLDSDLYEKATNDGLSFRTKGVLAAFGVKASKLIPDPTLLTPHYSDTFGKAGNLLREISRGSPNGGGSVSIISKLLRRRA